MKFRIRLFLFFLITINIFLFGLIVKQLATRFKPKDTHSTQAINAQVPENSYKTPVSTIFTSLRDDGDTSSFLNSYLTVGADADISDDLNIKDELRVDGNSTLSDTRINGDVILGKKSSKTVNIVGSIKSSLNLTKDNEFKLGSSDKRWSELFLGSTLDLESGKTVLRNVTYTWPVADGTSGQVLSTNGAGQLSWTSVSSDATTLQEAYNAGNDITLNSSDDILVSDDEGNPVFNISSTDSFVSVGTADPVVTLDVEGQMRLKPVLVSELPTCTEELLGSIAYVRDQPNGLDTICYCNASPEWRTINNTSCAEPS